MSSSSVWGDQGFPASTPLVTDGVVSPPAQWLEFCDQNSEYPACSIQDYTIWWSAELLASDDQELITDLTQLTAYRQLQDVNRAINNRVTYTSDIHAYNRVDFWQIAEKEGDCEDFALAKQQALLQLNWDMRNVRLATVSSTPWGAEGHCVLLVRLAGGDYVLDNNVATVLPWQQCGYRFFRVQVPGQLAWLKV